MFEEFCNYLIIIGICPWVANASLYTPYNSIEYQSKNDVDNAFLHKSLAWDTVNYNGSDRKWRRRDQAFKRLSELQGQKKASCFLYEIGLHLNRDIGVGREGIYDSTMITRMLRNHNTADKDSSNRGTEIETVSIKAGNACQSYFIQHKRFLSGMKKYQIYLENSSSSDRYKPLSDSYISLIKKYEFTEADKVSVTLDAILASEKESHNKLVAIQNKKQALEEANLAGFDT